MCSQLHHTLVIHLKPIEAALPQAASRSISLTLVVLGVYFYAPLNQEKDLSSTAAIASPRLEHWHSVVTYVACGKHPSPSRRA